MLSGVHKIQSIKELERLEFKDQLEYINNLIKKEGNLVKASSKLGAKKNMIKNIFKKKNYDYNEETQRFELGGESSTIRVHEDKKLYKKEQKKSKKVQKKQIGGNCDTDNIYENVVEIIKDDKCDTVGVQEIEGGKCTTLVLQEAEAQEKMLDLIKNYDSIKSMLEMFNNKKGAFALTGGESRTEGVLEVIEVITGIQIDLPNSDNIKTSIRTNRVEWELFKEFMKENKEFSNADLIAQALREFRLKHQKKK